VKISPEQNNKIPSGKYLLGMGYIFSLETVQLKARSNILLHVV
jgi:hypothetical protein